MNAATLLGTFQTWSGWMCHQLPDRSPHDDIGVFPVCFRCAGLHLGLAASYLSLHFSHFWHARFPSVRVAVILAAMMLPLMIDGAANALGWWSSPGWWRGLTGLGVGLALPWLLAPLARSRHESAELFSVRPRQLFFPAACGVMTVALLNSNCGPILFSVLAVTAAFGWHLFLGHFVLALVRACGISVARQLCAGIFPAKIKA